MTVFFANISLVDCKNTRLFYAKIDDGVFHVKISLMKTELTTYCKLFPTTIASVLKLHQHISENIIIGTFFFLLFNQIIGFILSRDISLLIHNF